MSYQRRCGCEDGLDCTKVSLCALQLAVEDAEEAKDAEIAHLEQALDEIINMDSCLLANAKAIAMAARKGDEGSNST